MTASLPSLEGGAPTPAQPGWRRDGPRFALVTWLLATLVMLAAVIGAAIAVAVTAALRASLGGERSTGALRAITEQAVESPALLWTALIATQLALFACAWLACRVLRQPARARLGLEPTYVSPLHGAVLIAASVLPFALGLGAAWCVELVIGSSSEGALGLRRMWSEGSRGASVAWILLIALLPGFAEEVFYRGFLQRGLLLRWGPAASILTSSLLFAAVHGELAWAAGIFPLGVWLGVVAWRTGSVRMTFAIHAGINGLWTACMMTLHRNPASEPVLNGIAVAALVLGGVAFPWALVLLRRRPWGEQGSVQQRRPLALLPRVGGTALAAGLVFLVLIPPGAAPRSPESTPVPAAPRLDEIEAGVVETVECTLPGEGGAVEFLLEPGIGKRVQLANNRANVEQVIVALDSSHDIVWLAYAGERTGKGSQRRPLGIVEQLRSGAPTLLCMTLSPGPPPVRVRLTLEADEASASAAFERAGAEGWARRGRK